MSQDGLTERPNRLLRTPCSVFRYSCRPSAREESCSWLSLRSIWEYLFEPLLQVDELLG